MGRIFSALVDYLTEDDWRYEIQEGQTRLRFNVQAKSGRLVCYGDVDEDKDILMFYSYLPANAPEEKRANIAEFITRANHGMRIGNFELDYSDGEVRYKTSMDIEGGELTPKMIENLLNANLSTMDRYFPGLMAGMYGNKPAADLIDEIERPRPPSGPVDLPELDDDDLDDDDDD